MTRAQAIAKLTKLFAMWSSMPTNRAEATVAKKRFEELSKRHGLSMAELLSADNPDRELVRAIVRERQQTVRKIRELSQFAVDEWKRQSEILSQWFAKQRARSWGPGEALDFSTNPATFAEAKRAAAEAKALGDYNFVPLSALGLSAEDQSVLLDILNKIADDEQFLKDFGDYFP